jgi:hypothetical protein
MEPSQSHTRLNTINNFRKISRTMPTAQSISSDWLTVQQSMSYCNISRSRLYSLREEPLIRTMSLRRRGRTRGIRYFSRSSLDSYFNQLADSQSGKNGRSGEALKERRSQTYPTRVSRPMACAPSITGAGREPRKD